MICKTCQKDFIQNHSSQRYCSDACTPYKNKLMAWDTWRSMHKRCSDPKTNGYLRYGGAGITVCDEWRDYHSFISDMGLKPTEFHQLDRIDSEKGYFKDNCRWVEQGINQRRSKRVRHIDFNGINMTLSEWANFLKLSPSTLSTRISKWGLTLALTTPRGPTGPKRS